MNNINESLRDVIQSELEELKDMEVGSDEYKTTVDGVTKLTDRVIELEKLNIEKQDKAENRKNDQDLKLKQMEEDKKDRLIKNCLSAAGIILPLGLTVWGTYKTFEFEKEGTVTTMMGRGFINKLFPKK